MSTDTKAMDVSKEEMLPETGERTRESRCFSPRSDIYETDEAIIVVMDLPGVQKDNIDISLEKNVLTVTGFVLLESPEGYTQAFSEYNVGDYERSFRISNQIEQAKIEAEYTNGVLRLSLPKAEAAKKRKISIKVG